MNKWILSLLCCANAFCSVEMINDETCRIEGKDFPLVAYGTYRLKGEKGAAAVEAAAKIGYRILDTATFYNNFDGLAIALKKCGRENFYIISKVWHDKQSPEDIRKDISFTLQELQIDCLDAYLLHWPNSKMSIEDSLTTMNELIKEKKIRHIGLSNVSVNHLKRALEVGVPITWVQVEMNPFFYDAELLQFCKDKSIAVQAWAPLARGRVCKDETLAAIGKKYGKTASQVAIRWVMQHGCMPLPMSKKEAHIQGNFHVSDFVLSSDDMTQLDKRAKEGPRERVDKSFLGFTDEYDFTYEQCWPKSGGQK